MNSRNNNTRFSTRTAFCKVCKDAGKCEALYTSHFVRDRPGPEGKVCCPTLLSLKCGYCHEMGHTPSCCPVLARRKMEEKKEERVQKRMELKETASGNNNLIKKVSVSSNPFALLDQVQLNDDVSKKEEFPSLSSVKSTKQPVLSGWAAIISVPKKTPSQKLLSDDTSNSDFEKKAPYQKLSWADMCESEFDSGSESEYEYYN